MYDATLRIVIFGDFFEERQAIFEKFLTNLFVSDKTMTIGIDFKVKSLIVDGRKIKLQIWDFGREERFKLLLPTYMRAARGGLFVYDVTNYSSLAHIDDWLSIIRKELSAEDKFPILAVGIVPDEMRERQVSTDKGVKIAKSRKLNGFIECNLKTGKNVEKAFQAITKLMLEDSGHLRGKREKVKDETKDEESINTCFLNLELKIKEALNNLRNLED